ncbi:aurora kinase A and ninein-interacting protein [Harpia harpyja]|uniref:aurora kinase A and ninein-interacting protein n=1 Tax=Harpia harpyja TaxID=202280 RepID=UPI0022B20BD2|nr:aurora kinase A and ninein-interacting protein [Harpia harpyja]
MKRRRKGDAAQQAEACDVWLDTAEVKQNAAQPPVAKPKAPSRILERKHASVTFTQTRASQPCTKQTIISAFFSAQTDEKDKENSRPSPFILNEDCKEKGVSLPAYPVKILALPQMEEAQKQSFRAEEVMVQVTPQCCAQKAPASSTPLPDSSMLQAESHSNSEASCAAGEDCCFFSFTQDSEGNRIIAHRNESDVFAGETVSASGSITSDCGINKQAGQLFLEAAKTRLDFQPRLGANQSKKPHQLSSANSLIDFSETENINPTIMRDSTWAAGAYSSPQRPARAQPLRERSQNAGAGSAEEGWGSKVGLSSPCRQLFTQDSEGNRVIAHRCQNVPSPHKDNGSSRRQLPDSPYEGRSSDAANRSVSKLGEQWLDVCYDLLFTQDSEGNRVIKH